MSRLLCYSTFRISGYVSKTVSDLLYLFIILIYNIYYYTIIVEDFVANFDVVVICRIE